MLLAPHPASTLWAPFSSHSPFDFRASTFFLDPVLSLLAVPPGQFEHLLHSAQNRASRNRGSALPLLSPPAAPRLPTSGPLSTGASVPLRPPSGGPPPAPSVLRRSQSPPLPAHVPPSCPFKKFPSSHPTYESIQGPMSPEHPSVTSCSRPVVPFQKHVKP